MEDDSLLTVHATTTDKSETSYATALSCKAAERSPKYPTGQRIQSKLAYVLTKPCTFLWFSLTTLSFLAEFLLSIAEHLTLRISANSDCPYHYSSH